MTDVIATVLGTTAGVGGVLVLLVMAVVPLLADLDMPGRGK